MNIAIIGVGNVGSALGPAFAANGHKIIYGVRDTSSQKVRDLLQQTGVNASAATVRDAAAEAETIFMALPWGVTERVIKNLGSFQNKVLIDCTNPIAPEFKGLLVGTNLSAGEQVQQWAKEARVVKAFNTTGAANMKNPDYSGQPVTMFICGDDQDANQTVAELASGIGFDPCITGPLYHARYLEPLAMLWVDMAYVQGKGPGFAFKIMRR